MLNLNHARTFLAVLEEGGVRAAARRLGLSPSTVLEHIRQLELELAAPLIVRRRGGVAPTRQGAHFLPFARSLVVTAERARHQIEGGALRLAAASNVGTYMLQGLIAEFQRAAAQAVEIWIGANPDVADRLESGEADVAAMEWWDGRAGFAARTWRREPLVVIAPPTAAWAGRQSVTLDELAGIPVLGGEGGTGTGRILRERLGRRADALRTVSGFGNTEAVKRAVRAGLGVSIVLAAAVAEEAAAGSLAVLTLADAPLYKELQLVVPEHLPENAAALSFVAAAGA